MVECLRLRLPCPRASARSLVSADPRPTADDPMRSASRHFASPRPGRPESMSRRKHSRCESADSAPETSARARSRYEPLCIVQARCDARIGARARQEIEVAGKDGRIAAVSMAQPVQRRSAYRPACLARAGPVPDGSSSSAACVSPRLISAQSAPRGSSLTGNRMAGSAPALTNRIGRAVRMASPILLLHHPHRRREVKIHPQFARDQLGLIEPVAAQTADVELLQRDDVRRADAITSAIRRGEMTRSRPLQAWTL